MDLTSYTISRIEDHKIESLPFEQDITLPLYDGLSLANIPCTVTRLLNVPNFGKPPLDAAILDRLVGPYKKVILLLVDALGKDLFDQVMSSQNDSFWRRNLKCGVYCPITSICPSTTASALTTLWTGEPACAHGVVGYEMWAKEYSMVMNNILHTAVHARGDVGGLSRSGFDPHEFINLPLLGTHLSQHGVAPTTFIHSSISNSGLSVMQMEDVNVKSYVDEADLGVSLAEYLNRRQGIRDYIYVYYSHVDTLMHRYNAQNIRVSLQFDAFSSMFEKAFIKGLSEKAAKETLLILTADHGSLTTLKYSRYDLSNHPKLMDLLVMQPTCENRLAFLYVKPGRLQAVRDYFETAWPQDFYLIESEIALNSGLFGDGLFHKNIQDRLGDLIAVARGDAYLWWAPKPNHMAGRHGGLSREEMLVPFFALPLERLIA